MTKEIARFHVEAPPSAVFAYLADPKTTMPGLTKSALLYEAPRGAGTAWRYEERLLGMHFSGIFVVTELVRNKRLKIEFSGALEEGAAEWTFKPAKGGTDVAIHSDFRLRIPVLGSLVAGFMMRTDRNRWLPALKEQIEQYARLHAVKPAA